MNLFRFYRRLIGGYWSLVPFGPVSLDNLTWIRGDHYKAHEVEYHGLSLEDVFRIDWGALV